MEEKKQEAPAKPWGDYIASTWRRKSETTSSSNSNNEPTADTSETKEEGKSGTEETGKSGAKTWGEMITPTSWIKTGDNAAAETGDNATDKQGDPNPQGKTWVPWRRKSRDDGDPSEGITCEVPKENGGSATATDESCSEKHKGKNDGSHSAKTWGEMIHPALAWRRKSKDGAETSEPTPVPVSPGEVTDDELKETGDDVPRAAEGTLYAVAASIKQSIAGMSRWSMADLTLGLYKLSGRHALEGVADTIDGSHVTSLEELQEVEHWFKWAFAAYKKNKEKLAKDLKVEESQIIKHVFTSGVLKPAYFIAVDDAKRYVVISIRGTLAATDVLTDLNPHSEKFEGGYAHSGMLAAARWLLDNEGATLRELLSSKPEYRFVLVGHSLGAGTAALLCMLLRDYDGGRDGPLSRLGIPPSWITCWGFGCPPCVDKRLAEEAGFIKNVVLQDDVVARVSPGALEDLRTEILETDWSQAFKDGSKGKKMLELAQSTLPSVAKKYGHAALVVARSGALAGTKIHKAANWFTVGIAAAELLRSAATYRGVPTTENVDEDEQQTDTNTEVAAATVVANVAEAAKDTKESLEMERLFVPGILYHILRKPLQPDMVLASVLPAQAEAASKDGEEIPKRLNRSNSKKGKQPQFQHIVVRGDDPSSRFKRIVLSSTLLSDHGCNQYKESLEDAIAWVEHEGSPVHINS